ncbi:MAG: glycosyl transferase [Pseudanabaena sp.]|nr:MAG: glycosyl transferase [Pseudanabaena sp.]
MKVLLCSSFDIGGGAARSAYRLHQGFQSLQDLHVESQILVQTKLSDDFRVLSGRNKLSNGIPKLRLTLDQLPLYSYPKRDRTIFSPQWLPNSLDSLIREAAPEIINLHWICHGFIPIKTLRQFKQPLVWTLHDMWAFTGGCHYSYDCDRYQHSCGICPQLHSHREYDLSRQIWQQKSKYWQNLDLRIVTPSNWLAKCAASSTLFKDLEIKVIPNGLDIEIYKPINRQLARQILNLPLNSKLILFGAIDATGDRRKGLHLLQPALQKLQRSLDITEIPTEILIMGASRPKSPLDFGLATHYLGKLNDDVTLALVYSAVDVFVAPSLQDNLANTVLEAIACGLPVVAFDIGGMSDMITHQQNGYLAKPFDTDEFAHGISWILEDGALRQYLSNHAREKAEREFSQELQAKRYAQLFEEIIASHKTLSTISGDLST